MLLILFAKSTPLGGIPGPHQASAVANCGLETMWKSTCLQNLKRKKSYCAWHSLPIPRLLYSWVCFVLYASAGKTPPKTVVWELGHRLQRESEQELAQNTKCRENILFCKKKKEQMQIP